MVAGVYQPFWCMYNITLGFRMFFLKFMKRALWISRYYQWLGNSGIYVYYMYVVVK